MPTPSSPTQQSPPKSFAPSTSRTRSTTNILIMFSPHAPFPAHMPRARRPKMLHPTWDHHWDTEVAHTPSFPDVADNIFSHPNPFTSSKNPKNLPSRIAALNRRAAIVQKNLEYLAAAIKPLETVKAGDLSRAHLHDMHQEGVGLIEALHAFEEQTLEVTDILGELLRSRRAAEVAPEIEWEENWEGWSTVTHGRGRIRKGLQK